MGLTWRANPIPDTEAFATLSTAIQNGALFWLTAEFYRMPDPMAGLQMVRRYYEAYPEHKDKVTLFVKGCSDLKTMAPTNTRAGVPRSVANCLDTLGGVKAIVLFGPARMEPSVSLTETMDALSELVSEGKIGDIGLSEVGAGTLENAHAIAPLSLVEVEISLQSTDILTNGVAASAKNLGVPIIANSPLGRGFLTGQIRSPRDIPAGDIRLYLGRFQRENFDKNLVLVRSYNRQQQRSKLHRLN